MRAIAAQPDSQQPLIVECPAPNRPGGGEILCRTRLLGICGTDREILLSRTPALPIGERWLVLGHECLAEVIEVGSQVTQFAAGDLVVPVVRRALPGYPRRADMLALGQFTERGIFYEHGFSAPVWLDRPEYVVPVPNELGELAVFTEPMAVAEKAIHEGVILQHARLGQTAWPDVTPRVLVTGLGPIAFAAMLSCRARRWRVTVYGRDDENTFRAQLAQRFGCRYVAEADWTEEPNDVEAEGFDLILECTGSDEVVVRTVGALASCGIIVWLGSSRVPVARTLNLAHVMRTGLTRNHIHLGTVNAAQRDFHAAVENLAGWQQRDADLVQQVFTERVSLDDALWHYEHRRPQGIKCVVEYGG
jgi:threonine dehydrogenase-like Zn-dependent dehydrogenase